MKKPLKLYWSSSLKDGKKNFGDWLSPALCERLSNRKVIHAKPQSCDLMAVGSILQKAKNHCFTRRVAVWGSGFIEAQPARKSKHDFYAVRGKKTASLIKDKTITTYGDPGLLSEILLDKPIQSKQFSVGVVPHYKDVNNPLIVDFLARHPRAKLINILSDTQTFLTEVGSCDAVLSSSLHGLIIADALNIPNAWIKLSQLVRGNDFKFFDYYSVFGHDNPVPFKFNHSTTENDILNHLGHYKRPGLEEIKQALMTSFPFK